MLTISEAQLEDAGDYSLVINNTFGQVVSSNAALIVDYFAGVAINFVVTNELRQNITISNLTLMRGSNVVQQAGSLDPGGYGILVNNVRDISAVQNAVAANSAVISSYSGLIIPADTLWRYDATGVDRGASAVWAGRDYDASTWTGAGQGLFAAERGVFPNGSGGNFPEPWEIVSLFSPHLISPTNSAAFFRVRR